MLLARLLERVIRVGALTVIDARGRVHRFAGCTGPAVTIRLHDPALHHRLFFHPLSAAGEAYTDGTLTVEEGGDIRDFLGLCGLNEAHLLSHPVTGFLAALPRLMRKLEQVNPVHRARRNVAHHYDLSGRLYELFLDADRQYSCAYFRLPEMDLDDAQRAKKDHLAAKLLLQPGQRILDIGSGWGGLALHLADEGAAQVNGLTLSEEQWHASMARAAAAGLGDRVSFHLRDYRLETGCYDRIVSVGMFEHVGVPHYREYFTKIAELLAEDGVALVHTIGRSGGPGRTNPWIRKYIFPGGYCPALSEILTALERTPLKVTDIEVLRLHYAETLAAWFARFQAHRAEVAALYDERFCRMWEFYLAGSEMSFRCGVMVVYQIQLAKEQTAVPLTRDYITRWKDRAQGRAERVESAA